MPPKKPIPKDFQETIDDLGITRYLCQPCSSFRGSAKIISAKSYLADHEKTVEHKRALETTQLDVLHRQTMAFEAAQEKQPVNAFNPASLLSVTSVPRRPSVSDYDPLMDYDYLDEVTFSAGQDVLEDFHKQMRLPPSYQYAFDKYGNEANDMDVTVSAVLSDLQRKDVDEVFEADDIFDILSRVPRKTEYFPYPNKVMFLLDMLDSAPRLRLSDSQLSFVLFILRESGVDKVPSLKTLRRMQEKLRRQIAVPTIRHSSMRGNVFYVNDISNQVARDFANPLIRRFIKLYPERTKGHVAEPYQANKWLNELGPNQLTPMVIGRDRQHFYVHELALTASGEFYIPMKWVTVDGRLCGDCWRAIEKDGVFTVDRTESITIPVSKFTLCYTSLLSRLRRVSFIFSEQDLDIQQKMPNSWRSKSQGRPVYCIQLNLWQDDVSGNVSKQWNKHLLFCMTMAGIPKKLLAQEYFTRFICCSPHASALEQAKAFADAIRSSKDGIIAYDSLYDEEAMLFLSILKDMADNPMTCEMCSHLGLRSNKFCPRCHIGGDRTYKISDVGYHSLFMYNAGRMRRASETKTRALEQLRLGLTGQPITKLQTFHGVKDDNVLFLLKGLLFEEEVGPPGDDEMDIESLDLEDLEDIESNSILNEGGTHPVAALPKVDDLDDDDKVNPFLSIEGFDPHLDSPVEPLHTVLLGVVKYAWALTCSAVDECGQLHTLQSRLQSIDVKGLNMDPIRASYLIQYRGSLIGRHFKTIVQTVAFTLHGIVSDEIIHMWVTAGHMVALLWFPEISDIDEYCTRLQTSIDTFLDALVSVDGIKIVSKAKCHILTHIVEDIRRFGPAITLSTETFESFNGVFRLCSVLSNHHAPSRDIAFNMADMARFRHIASGGKWKEGNDWLEPGHDVKRFFSMHEDVHNLLGWHNPDENRTGYTRKPGKGRGKTAAELDIPWTKSSAATSLDTYTSHPSDVEHVKVIKCTSTIIKTQDTVVPGTFVVLKNDNHTDIGRVVDILEKQPRENEFREVFLVVQKFSTGGLHARLKMPTLHATHLLLLARIENIKLAINVQHDCERGYCGLTKIQYESQERESTRLTYQTMKHSNDDHFVVNMHSIHQPQLLRAMFQPEMYPVPITIDREKLHHTLAAKVRTRVEERAVKLKEKRKERADAAKAKAETQDNKKAKVTVVTETPTDDHSSCPTPSTASSLPPVTLPQGWERLQTDDGRIYYVDHNTQTSSWEPPPNSNTLTQTHSTPSN